MGTLAIGSTQLTIHMQHSFNKCDIVSTNLALCFWEGVSWLDNELWIEIEDQFEQRRLQLTRTEADAEVSISVLERLTLQFNKDFMPYLQAINSRLRVSRNVMNHGLKDSYYRCQWCPDWQ